MNKIVELSQKGQELKQRIEKFGAPYGNKNAAGPHDGVGSSITPEMRKRAQNAPYNRSLLGKSGIRGKRETVQQIDARLAREARIKKALDSYFKAISGKGVSPEIVKAATEAIIKNIK